jgi:DeoR family glycerol-3-phosphate regulon repressor
MRPRDRQASIAEIIGREGQMSVDDLALRFGVSAETIRRDLGQLAEDGLVRKVHGGARRPRLHAEGTFQERMTDNATAKRALAEKLADLLEPGDTIFMDTGSTTLYCAEALAGLGGLTIITNSVAIAQVLGAPGTTNAVFLLGGQFSGANGETHGPLAIAQAGAFQADHAVLTVAAIDAKVGAMDASFDEARVAREMIDRSRQLLVVADSGKFDRMAAHRVCDLDEIDVLVSEQPPGAELSAALQRAGVELR